jgi:hypothetical protein
MDNELFVVWLIKSSDRARAAVGQALGDFAETDLLRRVAATGGAEERLAELAARIRAEFTPAQLPAVFTEHHLRMLVQRTTAPVLATVLGCSPHDVFDNLLDSHQLARTLRDSGHTQVQALDAELLLLEIFPRLARIAARFGLDSRDWGGFIERRGWLTLEAVRRLTAYGESREWPRDAQPTQILAGILEGVGNRSDLGLSARFDGLALIELRRRAGHISEQLRAEATRHAEEAAQLAPDLTAVSRLPAWLELYERQSIASGLLRLFTGAMSLADLLQGTHSKPPLVTGQPVAGERLQVTNESTFGVWRRRVAFDVSCRLEGDGEPQVILSCRGLPKDAYGPVRDRIVQVRGRDLALVGDTVGERLLNTHVARPQGFSGWLRRALQVRHVEVIQCFLLTGARQPILVPSPWHEYLARRLPYQTPSSQDTRFPSVDQVNQELRASAAGRRIEEMR